MPPVIVRFSLLTNELIDCVPLASVTVKPAGGPSMVTSAAAPGREGLDDQFVAIVHWPDEPAVHETVLAVAEEPINRKVA